MGKKLTTEQFIERAISVHGDRYDYSKVNYINTTTKIEIICQKHGSFFQRPYGHLEGKGCAYCSGNVNLTTKEFITIAKKIYGKKYDYSKVNYVNNKTKVTIVCPEHGEFLISPSKTLGTRNSPDFTDGAFLSNSSLRSSSVTLSCLVG